MKGVSVSISERERETGEATMSKRRRNAETSWSCGTQPRAKQRKLRIEQLEDRRLLAVVINEIHYNPADNTSLEEFVELHNTGPAAVNVSGWAFTDGIAFTFPTGAQIPAGGYAVVAQNPATILSKFGVTAVGAYSGNLSSDGETIELRDNLGQLIDEVTYAVSSPWPVASDGSGPSMELINPSLNNNLGSSWRPAYTPPLFPPPADPPPTPSGGLLANVVHRYSFSGNVQDSVGTAHGTLVDPGAIATYGSGKLNVSANNNSHNSNQTPFTSGAYVNLPNGIISSLGGDATFEWWGTVSTNRTWAEIFSFGVSDQGENAAGTALNQEYLTLIPQAGSGRLRFTHRDGGSGAESFIDWTAAPTTGIEYHFALTWDTATDTQRLYVNGVLAGSSALLIDLVDVEDTNNWLGRSQWADPLFDGLHNEFRIYNRALSASDVTTSFNAGPDAVAAGPVINTFVATPTQLNVGQSATLSWTVTGATSLAINQGVGNVTGQSQIVVSPGATTTYTLTATDGSGNSTNRSVKVTVEFPRATPGSQNNVYSTNAAPAVRDIQHTTDPTSATPATISAKVTDPEGVASVQLQYQIVLPGQYLPAWLPVPTAQLIADGTLEPTANPVYFAAASWTTVNMFDTGANGDLVAGDTIYSAIIPAQSHRTLVRYRLVVTDTLGKSATVPYGDDRALNFAYFVYNGVPEYRNNSNVVVANSTQLASLPTYHFLTRAADMEDVLAYDGADEIPQGVEGRFAYNWSGAMVYNGKVYDHISYRLRGANGRYLADGKRSMRFRFNDGSWFEPLDQDGVPYPEKWKTLTTGKGFDNRQTLTYALNEAMTMMLSNMMGLPAPETHWFQFRVIDSAAEAPDQYRGDFWGINFALEDYDKRFLDAHGLEAGNLYKLINQTDDALRQQDYQAPFAVSDGSDHDYIEDLLTRASTDIEHRVNLQKYFVFHALVEAVRHYDFWPTANKNMTYYFEPTYTPQNNNFGKLWVLLWDTDATWGPTWNEGKDVVYDALFENNNTAYKNTLINPQYYNTLRELRDLIWQPDQLRGMVEELVSKILPLEAADRARWQGAPADAGNYNGLGGAGATSLSTLVEDMLNFAFTGGSWPGGTVGPGGRAAYLDGLLTASGEEALIPNTPAISYVGDAGMAANRLTFQTTAFADPQGAGTRQAVQWRIAKVTDVAAGLDTSRKFLDEWTSSWDSGALTSGINTISPPSAAVTPGETHRARVRFQDSTGRWSHWSAPLTFTPTAADNLQLTKDFLRISEVHYNPAIALPQYGDDAVDAEEFEFIELVNTSATDTIDLTNVQLAVGVTFTFPAGSFLLPGARVLVVEDQGNFQSRYGSGLNIAGEWTGALNNSGEQLQLLASDAFVIHSFTYADTWYTRTDGRGSSLEVIDLAGNYNDARNWRASIAYNGTPGAAALTTVDIVVNEVSANPLVAGTDTIELHNPTASPINLSGWWLSDQGSSLLKYQIPSGTIVPAGGFITFTESQFNPGNGANLTDFALSSGGDQVWVLAAAANGKPIRFADVVDFNASAPGVTQGRVPDGVLGYGIFPMASATLGATNSGHLASSAVVISEVQYQPAAPALGSPITATQLEYIELTNTSAAAIDLSGWRLGGGVTFTFGAGTTIGAGQSIIVVNFPSTNTAVANAFRATYGLSASVPLIGPYVTAIDDRGGEVTLLAPATTPVGETGPVFALVDRVTYDDVAPWPTANGTGSTLTRTTPQSFGDFAASWTGATPSPGVNTFPRPGDYDRDHDVDQNDRTFWATHFGATAGLGLQADGNNDGAVDAADYTIWRDNLPTPTAAVVAVASASVSTNHPVILAPTSSVSRVAFAATPARRAAFTGSSPGESGVNLLVLEQAFERYDRTLRVLEPDFNDSARSHCDTAASEDPAERMWAELGDAETSLRRSPRRLASGSTHR